MKSWFKTRNIVTFFTMLNISNAKGCAKDAKKTNNLRPFIKLLNAPLPIFQTEPIVGAFGLWNQQEFVFVRKIAILIPSDTMKNSFTRFPADVLI